jgi:hypothetical protein
MHGKQDLTLKLAVALLQTVIGPKVTPGMQANATCIGGMMDGGKQTY